MRNTQGEPRLSDLAMRRCSTTPRSFVALAPETKLCAVIKADAYGHGARARRRCTLQLRYRRHRQAAQSIKLAVATIDEAAALPDVNIPILILRPIENVFLGRQRAAIELAIRSGWILTIDSMSAADDVCAHRGQLPARGPDQHHDRHRHDARRNRLKPICPNCFVASKREAA